MKKVMKLLLNLHMEPSFELRVSEVGSILDLLKSLNQEKDLKRCSNVYVSNQREE